MADVPAALGVVSGVGILDLLQGRLLGGDVGRSDLVGPLECHVLEHVREPGDPGDFLRRADVHHGGIGEHRRFRAFIDDERQAVVELLDGDPLLDRGEVLTPQVGCHHERCDKARSSHD